MKLILISKHFLLFNNMLNLIQRKINPQLFLKTRFFSELFPYGILNITVEEHVHYSVTTLNLKDEGTYSLN